MRKLYLVVVFFLLVAGAKAQTAYTGVTRNIVTTGQYCSSSSRCKITGTGAAFHQLTWNVSGILSACSVQVDSSANGTIWNSGDVIASQTCTSNGTITSTSNVVNYIRVNVTAITPVAGANLTVNLTGFVNLPSGGGNLSGTLTASRVPFSSAATTLTDDANLFWDNTNKVLGIGTSTPVSTAKLSIIGTAADPGRIPIETHASAISTVETIFVHSDSSFRGPSVLYNRSRGTQALPTAVQSGDSMGFFTWNGYDGTTYGQAAQISLLAVGNFTGSSHGSTIIVNTTPSGSTTGAEVFRFANSGTNGNMSSVYLGAINGKPIGWAGGGGSAGPLDTGLSKLAADIIGFGNGTQGDTTAQLKAAAYMAVGTKFTQDTGCGTIVTSSGGATAGKFTTVGSTSCTTVITMGNSATAPNGWDCHALDLTTAADVTNPHQTASTTTTATIATGTIVANDVIQFSCMGY